MSTLTTLIRKEYRDALRNRWLLGYAGVLALLGFAAALLANQDAQGLAFQTFGRTTATLTNLCLMLAPLIALSMGATSIAGERDRATLEFLLAQPLTRGELILGKFLGMAMALWGATFLGFLPAGLMVGLVAGGRAVLYFTLFPLIACLLIGATLGLGILISVRSATAVQAQGLAMFLWFALVLLYDLVLMGTLAVASMPTAVLSGLLIANPVDAARVLGVLALEPDLYLLGPAGALWVEECGVAGTVAILLTSLLAWGALGLGAAWAGFRLRPAPRRRQTKQAPSGRRWISLPSEPATEEMEAQ